MNAIIGMAHLVLRTNLNDQQQNYLDKVYGSAEGLLGKLNDILDFSKIESGKMDMKEIWFRLDEVVKGVLNLIRFKAQEKDIQLRADMDPACLRD